MYPSIYAIIRNVHFHSNENNGPSDNEQDVSETIFYKRVYAINSNFREIIAFVPLTRKR